MTHEIFIIYWCSKYNVKQKVNEELQYKNLLDPKA